MHIIFTDLQKEIRQQSGIFPSAIYECGSFIDHLNTDHGWSDATDNSDNTLCASVKSKL